MSSECGALTERLTGTDSLPAALPGGAEAFKLASMASSQTGATAATCTARGCLPNPRIFPTDWASGFRTGSDCEVVPMRGNVRVRRFRRLVRS
jgi:hypothetical protein